MHTSYYKRPLLFLLVLYIALLCLFYKPTPSATDVSRFIPQKNVTLTGKVLGFPVAKNTHSNVILKVYDVNGKPADGYVYARFEDYVPAWRETVFVHGTLKKPYSVALLGNFDWSAYLASKEVFSEIRVFHARQIKPPSLLARAISAARQDILSVFSHSFDANAAAIASGILLGERAALDESLYEDFQDSGAIHLLVASGGNVGFVTLMTFAFCGLFGLRRRQTAFLALLIAGLYTLIAGADAPLVRAYFMAFCAVAGYFLHRNSGVFQGLVLSCFFILLFHPAAVFETGFQMSFLATLAIIICLNNYTLPPAWPRWIRFFVQIFLATLSTQLVLLPVFTNVFFKISFVGLLANMLLVPLASFLMALSFAYYVFSLLHIGFLLQAVTAAFLGLFEHLVVWFASFPLASVPAAAWRSGWVISYYAAVFLLFHLPQKDFVRRICMPLAALMLFAPAIQYLFFNSPTVWLLNEWNHNAVLYRSADGTRILFGAAIDGDKLARSVLKSGSRTLDAIFISENMQAQMEEVQKLQKQIFVKRTILPFENIWPSQQTAVEGRTVSAEWGLLLNRRGELWRNRGYSGGRDSLSYEITDGRKNFTVAANSRFILLNGRRIDNSRNATCTVHL